MRQIGQQHELTCQVGIPAVSDYAAYDQRQGGHAQKRLFAEPRDDQQQDRDDGPKQDLSCPEIEGERSLGDQA